MHDTVFSKEIINFLEAKSGSLKKGKKIKKVRVALSPLSHVKPEALIETFSLMVKGTKFEDVSIEVNALGLEVVCGSCGSEFSVSSPVFSCKKCGGTIDIKNVREFVVESTETA